MSNISKIELEFDEFIKTLGIFYKRNDRSILLQANTSNYELDFWFPYQKIGIEFDGDYYHNNGYYNIPDFFISCYEFPFLKRFLIKEKNGHYKYKRNNERNITKFASSYRSNVFVYHVYEFEWRDEELKQKVKQDIKNILTNNYNHYDLSKNKIIIDAGKEDYIYLINNGYKITKYIEPQLIKEQGSLKIYNYGLLEMKKVS